VSKITLATQSQSDKAHLVRFPKTIKEQRKMRPANTELKKYETIRVTSEAKAAVLELALREGVEKGRRISIADVASRLILEAHRQLDRTPKE
jgi:hypothetical protein